MKTKKTSIFYGIGVGPGDPELLTLKAIRALKSSDYIFEASSGKGRESIAGSVACKYASKKAKLIPIVFPMVKDASIRRKAWVKNAEKIAGKLKKGFTCSFVTIGDPMVYSTCSYLVGEIRKIIPALKLEIVPGITSFQLAAAKAQIPLAEDKEIISIYPAFSDDVVRKIKTSQADTMVVMKPFKTRKKILALVKKHGCTGVYASKLGLKDEIIATDLSGIGELPEEYLSLFIIKKKTSHART